VGAVCVVVGVVVLAGCGGHRQGAAAVAPTVAGRRPGSPQASPGGPPPYQWLSGRPYSGPRPVLAVKIDNVGPARPQVGVDAADVVYVEEVEYGLTRLMAMYSSHLPATVGPVRSARSNDIELLASYGRPVLAFSGANTGVAAEVAAADIVDASADLLPAYFFRDSTGGRVIPHNLFLTPAALLAGHPSSPSRDVGFRFGTAAAGGTVASEVSVRYPAAAYTFDYAAGRYLLTLDGTPDVEASGYRLGPTNVILQYVAVHNDRYVDVNGAVSRYSVTVGGGRGTFYRGGREFPVTWSRPVAGGPTHFHYADGTDVRLGVGQTWVLLVPAGTPLSFR
jgi:Protein of unknown function (DUF3048) N-terminal domain/Protein of unknown function (DUF3048) C-terminal domain